MDVTPLINSDAQVIQSYAEQEFQVSGESYNGAVFVTIDKTTLWQRAQGKTLDLLSIDDLTPLIDKANDIDVILLGTGAKMAFLDTGFRMQLKQAGLNVEFMDTGAACRTYNVLMAEGRRVVAALLPF